jgi:nitrate reductase molybdenum cofactor assembly chaperone NarJ/NarW
MRWPVAKLVFGCASVLLSYPEEGFSDDLAAVADVLGRLPKGDERARMEETRAWLAGMSAMEAAACYVDTFDLHRRRTLHLTYYRHGDTRERGMALTALVDAYRAAGVSVVPGELPDFLPALLELAAMVPAGAAVLAEHRAALDALRAELTKAESLYAGVVEAATTALGPSSRADRDALRRYRAHGPPSERVGLEPFAPPEITHFGVTRR